MSSPYAVLGDRPIDHWKVTELKEELKKRKLSVKGLKEDLVKRLDEAIRTETDISEGNTDNGFDTDLQPELQSEQAMTVLFVSETAKDLKDTENIFIEKVGGGMREVEVDDIKVILDKGKLVEEEITHGSDYVGVEREHVTTLETSVMVEKPEPVTAFNVQPLNSTEKKNGHGDLTAQIDDEDSKSQQNSKLNLSDSNSQVSEVSESVVSVIPLGESNAQNCEIPTESNKSEMQLENDSTKSLHMDAKLKSADINYQVSDVNSELRVQVISDSVSTESVSVTKENELKIDVVADDVKSLELKPEVEQSLSSNVIPDGGESYPMDVEESRDNMVSVEEAGGSNVENVDTLMKNNAGNMGSIEKLNFDQMEEDVLESKLMDSKSNCDEMMDKGDRTEMPTMKEEDILESELMDSKSKFDEMRVGGEKIELPVMNEEDCVDVVGDDKIDVLLVSNVGSKNESDLTSIKRKSIDQAAVGNNDVLKRQRRWKSEALKVPEPQSGNIIDSITPKDSFKPALKRSFSRSDSTVSEEMPKERVVPPSAKPHTNALRIDNFLRPFTLKAVQELLGKRGIITNFWMDHIKTHCYVSYSSVEEAVETRNAVYNLQWPSNGGRLLVAEFVDPQEVKTRVEAPPLSPATPSGSAPNFSPVQPTLQLPQPSPRQQLQRQHLPPPPSLPPPPPPLPLANILPVKERPQLEREPHREQPLPARERLNLPPPPPLAEKVDQPIVTLDDLFRKTKAIPRVYYLPLSDEQVAEKVKAQGKNVQQ